MFIKELPNSVLSRIAVGEIIDRPFYVLKELIENSFDANSSNISVFINGFGIDLIKVIDDGCGIDKDDLNLSILKNTTSRINNVDDLNRITTYGFRGEALFAISSVSNFEIISKTSKQSIGWKFYLIDGIQFIDPFFCNNGSTFIVKNLFFNNSIRKSLLKSGKIELNFMHEIFKTMSFAKFEVRMNLFIDGKEYLFLPPCLNLIDLFRRIKFLFGKKISESLFEININNNDFKFFGFLSKINSFNYSVKFQYFFLNRRIIYNIVVKTAIDNAYKKFGYSISDVNYCLYFELDTSFYDINFNPKKDDVRFYDSLSIYSFLYTNIVDLLYKMSNKSISYNNNCKKIKFNIDYLTNTSLNGNFFFIDGNLKKFDLNSIKYSNFFIFNVNYIFIFEPCDFYVFNINLFRKKLFIRSFYDNLANNFKLSSKELIDFKFIDITISASCVFDLSNIFLNYGFILEQVNEKTIMVKSVPEILYYLNFNWTCFFYNFILYFSDKFFNFSDLNLINEKVLYLFLNNIDYNSFYSKENFNYFYEKLFIVKNSNDSFFDDCFLKFNSSFFDKYF